MGHSEYDPAMDNRAAWNAGLTRESPFSYLTLLQVMRYKPLRLQRLFTRASAIDCPVPGIPESRSRSPLVVDYRRVGLAPRISH
jgi:hypothetical protein